MLKYINNDLISEDNKEENERLDKLFQNYAVKISSYIHNFIIDIIEHKTEYKVSEITWAHPDEETGENQKELFQAISIIDEKNEYLGVTKYGAIFYANGSFRPESNTTNFDLISVPYLELTDKFSITDYEANKLARCVDYFSGKLDIL